MLRERGVELESRPVPPAAVTIRAASHDDLDAVASLVVACDEHDLGEADSLETVLIDLRTEWQRPTHAAWVAADGGGGIVGWTGVALHRAHEAFVDPNGCVRPDRRGIGIGSALLERAEERARKLEPPARVAKTAVSGANPSASALFEARGYRRTQRSWQMSIEFESPPELPEWPPGFTVRQYRRGDDDRELYELVYGAFADNEGYDRSNRTFEEWSRSMLPDGVDTDLYFVVEHRGHIVACALCPVYPDEGWIRQLAVHRDYRGQGLGMAILRHAFRAFYGRGHRKAGLTVDSWNTTGARRLYERAGMRESLVHDYYEKPRGR